MLKKDENREQFYITYSKSVMRGIIISIILLIAAALIFFFSNLKEEYLNTAVWIITVLSICYSSIYGANKIGSKGYLHGAGIGGFYVLVLAIIAVLYGKGHLNVASYLIMFAMSLVVGAMAGMIGILIGNSN